MPDPADSTTTAAEDAGGGDAPRDAPDHSWLDFDTTIRGEIPPVGRGASFSNKADEEQ